MRKQKLAPPPPLPPLALARLSKDRYDVCDATFDENGEPDWYRPWTESATNEHCVKLMFRRKNSKGEFEHQNMWVWFRGIQGDLCYGVLSNHPAWTGRSLRYGSKVVFRRNQILDICEVPSAVRRDMPPCFLRD